MANVWDSALAELEAEEPTSAVAVAEPPSPTDYGLRRDGTRKGPGWKGDINKGKGPAITELSTDADGLFFPLIVPGSTEQELEYMRSGAKPTKALVGKALAHARSRIAAGKSVWADAAPRAGVWEQALAELEAEQPKTWQPGMGTEPSMEQMTAYLEKPLVEPLPEAKLRRGQTWPQAIFGPIARGGLKQVGAGLLRTAKRRTLQTVPGRLGAWVSSKSPRWLPYWVRGDTDVVEMAAQAMDDLADAHPEWAPAQIETAQQLLSDPKALVGNVTSMLPFMATTTAAFVAGGPVAAGLVSYAVESQGAYENAIASGASKDQAEFAANITGLVNSVIEVAQVGQWIKFAKGGARTALAKQVTMLAKAKMLGGITLKHAVREGLEEGLQGTTEDLVGWATYGKKPEDFWNQRTVETVLGAAGGLLMGFGGMAVTAAAAKIAPKAPVEPKAPTPPAIPPAKVPKAKPPVKMTPRQRVAHERVIGQGIMDMSGKPIRVNPDGTVTLYHRTSEAAAKQMKQTGKFISKENTDETFFSNKPSGQAEGYGDAVVAIRVPARHIRINDAFPDEIHVAVSNKNITKHNLIADLPRAETVPKPPLAKAVSAAQPTPPAKAEKPALIEAKPAALLADMTRKELFVEAEKYGVKKQGTSDSLRQKIEAAREAGVAPIALEERARISKITKAEQKARLAGLRGRKAQIRKVTKQVAPTEPAVAPMKALTAVFRASQKAAVKGYRAGQLDLIATHQELLDFTKTHLPKSEVSRVIPAILKTKDTPAQRRVIIRKINRILENYDKHTAVAELKQVFSKIDRRHMRPEMVVQVDALLKDFTLAKPAEATLRRANKLIDAVGRDWFGEIPRRVIDRAIRNLERAEKTPIRKLAAAEIREITLGLATIVHANATKNRLYFTRKHKNAKEAIETATGEVTGRHKPPGQSVLGKWSERRSQNAILRIATWDQLSLDTKAYLIGGDQGAVYEILYDGLHRGENERMALVSTIHDYVMKTLGEQGLDFKTLSKWTTRVGGKKADLVTVELPTATAPNGRRVTSLEMTKAERARLLWHLTDSQTRTELIRDKHKGITFARELGADAIKLRIGDIVAIEESATPQERAIVEMAHRIVTDDTLLRGSLNEAWRAENGWDIATRDDHSPRMRDPEYRKESKDPNIVMQQWVDRQLEQQSPFQPRSFSNEPIVIGDIFVDLMTHTNRVAAYVGKGRAVHDAMRLLQDRGFRNTVRGSMKRGNDLLGDIEKTVKDYRGLDVIPPETIERAVKGAIRRIHVGALALKPQIVTYQFVSWLNATNEINIFAGSAKVALSKELDTKLKQYSPTLRARFEGSAHQILTPGTAGPAAELFYGGKEGRLIGRASMKPIHWADTRVIKAIAAAAHAEGTGKGLSGEELWKYVAERTEQVVARTQPTWDVLTNSSIHRAARKNPLVKLLFTLFSSQRGKNLNMAVRAASEYAHSKKGPADYARFARKISVPTIVNATLIYGIGLAWWKLIGTAKDEGWLDYVAGILRRGFGIWLVAGDLVATGMDAVRKGIKGTPGIFVGRRGDPLHEAANEAAQAVAGVTKAVGEAASKKVYKRGPYKGQRKAFYTMMRTLEKSTRAVGMVAGLPIHGVHQMVRPHLPGRKKAVKKPKKIPVEPV